MLAEIDLRSEADVASQVRKRTLQEGQRLLNQVSTPKEMAWWRRKDDDDDARSSLGWFLGCIL